MQVQRLRSHWRIEWAGRALLEVLRKRQLAG